MIPVISLVTPNLNYADFLDAAMRSVLEQRCPNLEYIVVDGGSTDGSIDIIRRYEQRLAHWETRPKRGQYADITAGFARSTGEIMGWLNSDDMHLPWTLRAVGEIFQSLPNVEWISTLKPGHWDCTGYNLGFSSVSGFSKEAFMDGRYLPARATAASLPQISYIQQESTFWRRSLWEKAGGYVSQDFGMAGDFELWSRFYRHTELFGVDIPLAGFRHQHRQQSAQPGRYAEQSGVLLDELCGKWAGVHRGCGMLRTKCGIESPNHCLGGSNMLERASFAGILKTPTQDGRLKHTGFLDHDA